MGSPGRYANFVNTQRDFLMLHRRVYFDVCSYSASDNESVKISFYQWTIYDLNKTSVLNDFNGTKCLRGWAAPEDGVYNLRVKKFSANGTAVASAGEQFFVKDIWLVAIGDSFASGQGNPDAWGNSRSHPALWVHRPCGRASFGSFSYLIYKNIANAYPKHGILFTYLACTEASIRQGLLDSQESQSAQMTTLLGPIVAVSKKKKKPDLVLLTIGANDIGFFDVVLQVLMGIMSLESSYNRLQLPEKFANLTLSLHQLQDTFLAYGIDPSDVFYFEYFDPMRNERGELDSSCAGLLFATDDDFKIAYETVLLPLNALIKNQSKILGWNCVENIAEAFYTHGYCSKVSYIRTMESSLESQGTALGTFHPTYTGHQLVAKLAWPKIAEHLERKLKFR